MRELSRREILIGGAVVAAGAIVLPGCRGGGSNTDGADMPGPMWPVTMRPFGPSSPSKMQPLTTTPFPQPAPSVPSENVYPQVIARTAWTNVGVARPRDIFPIGQITRITVHHDGMNTFTTSGQGDAARRLEQIRGSHVNARGWADIGYHYVIDPAGRVWAARDTRYQGAHVKFKNEGNLGVMCMGNYDRQAVSSGTLGTLSRFLAAQQRFYSVPTARVFTHRELDATECPGTSLQREMVKMRMRGGTLAATLQSLGAAHLA
ncbi:hypothetical protein BH11PLA1_BH11PLA1_01100 [soil metagenome]